MIVAESTRPERWRASDPPGSVKIRWSPSRSTSRLTSAAVFCHSHSETARVNSEESVYPMASASATIPIRHSPEKRVKTGCLSQFIPLP